MTFSDAAFRFYGDGMVIGFTVFYLVVYAYAELSWVLIGEAQQGTDRAVCGQESVRPGRCRAAFDHKHAAVAPGGSRASIGKNFGDGEQFGTELNHRTGDVVR